MPRGSRRRAFLPMSFALAAASCAAPSVNSEEEVSATGAVSAELSAGADLEVTRVSAPPSATPGQSLTVSATVCNRGSSVTSARIAAFASSDASIDAADLELGAADVAAIVPYQCLDVAISARAPSGPGAFFVGVIADPRNQVAETDEANNARRGGWLGVGWGPDLVVSAVRSPASLDRGSRVDVTVCNRGTTPTTSPTFAELRLSGDAVVTSADALVGAVSVGPLAAGGCESTSTLVVPPPVPLADGAYTLGVLVDPTNATTELVERNNTTSAGLVGYGQAADLVVTEVSGPPAAQGDFSARATVCNQGTVASEPTDVTLHVSEDATITPSDVEIGSARVDLLAPGGCSTVVVPARFAVGPGRRALFLGAIVDRLERTRELQEANNARSGALIGFGDGPDFVVTLSAPAEVPGTFQATARLCNQGTAAGSANVALYASPDRALELRDPRVGVIHLGPTSSTLAPGACESLRMVVALPPWFRSPAYLSAVADPSNAVVELLESNNVSAARLVRTTGL